jgi:hypothetical protein
MNLSMNLPSFRCKDFLFQLQFMDRRSSQVLDMLRANWSVGRLGAWGLDDQPFFTDGLPMACFSFEWPTANLKI